MELGCRVMDTADATATRHFLAWIPHRRPGTAPKLDDPSSITTRAFRPTAHVTGQLGLTRRVRPGDVIWLAGNYPQLGRPEAALDGRIVVASVRAEKGTGGRNKRGKRDRGKLIYEAGDESAWLPWSDASELLYSCKFASRGGPVTLRRDRSLGQQLRFTLQLCSASAAEVEAFAAAVLVKPLFVSYRWSDSTDVVAALLPKLAAAGYSVWWDRWSGPRRLTEEEAPPPELASMLEMAIERASAALVVLGASYCEGRWTAYEYAEIERRDVPKVEITDSKLRSAVAGSGVDGLLSRLKALPRRPPAA